MTEILPAAEGLIVNAAIRCVHTSIMNPKDLHPHPLNPNTHPPKQIEMFIAILGFQGWRRPITVSTRSNFVTKGHGALESALAAGYTEVPVDYQDYDNEQQELADIVADNQLQRMSEMNTGKLNALLVNLNTGAMNLEMTGFETSKLEKMLGVTKTPELKFSADENGSSTALAGAPVEPGGEYVALPADGSQSESPYADTAGDRGRVASTHVRMMQLYFTEDGIAEFLELSEFFQKEFGIDNVSDVVLEVLKRAKAGYDVAPESES